MRGAKATGREVTRHGHRAVDRGRPTSGGPVRSTGRTAFFPSHSVPTGPPFLTGRTSMFLPESNGPARLTMAVLGRPPGARVRRPRRASEGAARCTWWATISAETAGERKTLEKCRQRAVSRKRAVENCGTAVRRSRWQAAEHTLEHAGERRRDRDRRARVAPLGGGGTDNQMALVVGI